MSKKNIEPGFVLPAAIQSKLKELFALPRGYKQLYVGTDGSIYVEAGDAMAHGKKYAITFVEVDKELNVKEFALVEAQN